MNERGIVYIATQQDRHVEEAFRAAEMAKRHAPGLPITLFTDRPLHAPGCFDRIEQISGAACGDVRANATLNRFIGLARTPYQRTLYLDTDANVVSGKVTGIFDVLDRSDVALVEDVPGTSDALAHTGRRMFNCGVILYRRDTGEAWLQAWREAALRNLALARETPVPVIPEVATVPSPDTRRWLLEVDKIALLGVLPPDRPQALARVHVLDHSWNYRGPAADASVNIHHPHSRA